MDPSTSVDLPQSQPLPLPSPTVWPGPGVSKVISFSHEEAEESQKFPYINAIPPPPTGKTGLDIQKHPYYIKGKASAVELYNVIFNLKKVNIYIQREKKE